MLNKEETITDSLDTLCTNNTFYCIHGDSERNGDDIQAKRIQIGMTLLSN